MCRRSRTIAILLARARSPALNRHSDSASPASAFGHSPAEETPNRPGHASAAEPPEQAQPARSQRHTTGNEPARANGSAAENSEKSPEESEQAQGGDLAAIEIPPALAGFMEKLLAASRKSAVESDAAGNPARGGGERWKARWYGSYALKWSSTRRVR